MQRGQIVSDEGPEVPAWAQGCGHRAPGPGPAGQRSLRGGLLPRRPGVDLLCPVVQTVWEGNLSQITEV